MPTIDLDFPKTWPKPLLKRIGDSCSALIEERKARDKFDRSSERWIQSAPSAPVTKEVLELIRIELSGWDLRVFHATRLLDFNTVTANGLRPLSLKERVSKLHELDDSGYFPTLSEPLSEIIGTVDLAQQSFSSREGSVWATPLRRILYDGGCDALFDHWGGEAVQDLASTASSELEKAIRTVGQPAVVVMRIPVFGFCERSESRLPETLLELALEAHGCEDVSIGAWDVMMSKPVPADWIESIVSPDAPEVSIDCE